MIINIEQIKNNLIISYINKQGSTSFLNINIPESQQYKWEYCKQNARANTKYISYDNKPVRKVLSKYLDKFRFQEFLIDIGDDKVNCLFENNRPQLSFCDIETAISEDGGFPDPNLADQPINTIALCKYPNVIVWGNKLLTENEINEISKQINDHVKCLGKSYNFIYKFFENESQLLYDYLYYIKDQTAICGWNFLGFDWKYIYNRCNNLGINLSFLSPTKKMYTYTFTDKRGKDSVILPKHKLIFDYLAIYSKWDRSIDIKENNTLDFVSEAALGIKKVKYNGGFMELYNNNFSKYVFYNAIDTILVENIDDKLKNFNTFMALANLVRMECMNIFSPIAIIESTLCQYAYKEGKVLPRKERTGEAQEYEGAFVYEPTPGLYKWVASFDFASLYPTTIRMMNISIENFIKKDKNAQVDKDYIKCKSGAIFHKGNYLIPEMMTDIFARRKSAKKVSKGAQQEVDELKHILKERFE